MENFQKNKFFYSFLVLSGLGLVAGITLAVLSYVKMHESGRILKDERKKVGEFLAGYVLDPDAPAVSLTKENSAAVKKDLEGLRGHGQDLLLSITGPQDKQIVGKASLSNGSELLSLIKQSVDVWTKLAKEKKVLLQPNEKCDFGFRRYIRNQGASPKKELPRVDQQRKIIDFILKTLADSQPGGPLSMPILLDSIDREPIETFEKIAEGKPGAGTWGPNESIRNERDEFAPDRTFAQEGLIDALSFRVRFVSSTATLRTFINKLRASGYPIVITSVEVGTPSPELTKLLLPSVPQGEAAKNVDSTSPDSTLSPDEADSKAGPVRETRRSIVRRLPSVFSIQLQYLSMVKPQPQAGGQKK